MKNMNTTVIISGLLTGLSVSTASAVDRGWTEDFSNGVGRLSVVHGDGSTDFSHLPGDESIFAVFERRNVATDPLSRRIAMLDRSFTDADDAGFSFEWTPLTGTDGFSWPILGFFDSATLSEVGTVRIRDNILSPYHGSLELSLNANVSGNTFTVNSEELRWDGGNTYQLNFYISGHQRELHFRLFVLEGNSWQLVSENFWFVPNDISWSFDSLGMGNIVDESFGSTGTAIIDNVSFVTCPADLTHDVSVDFFDVSAFLTYFQLGDLTADFNDDGNLDFFDVSEFLSAYQSGCP